MFISLPQGNPECLQHPFIMGSSSKYHTERFEHINTSMKLNISVDLNISKKIRENLFFASDSSPRHIEIKNLPNV